MVSSTSFLVPVSSILGASNPYGFSALLDSGASHCFLSPKIVKKFKLHTNPVKPPLPLSMFDGTSVIYVTEQLSINVSFPDGVTHHIAFFVAPLDPTCDAVLGLNWLSKYNLLVDWSLCQITFHTPKHVKILLPESTPASSMIAAHTVSIPTSLSTPAVVGTLHCRLTAATCTPAFPAPSPPDICLINAVAFLQASKLEGSKTFHISPDTLRLHSAKLPDDEQIDLSNIPEHYHDFADIFSKCHADTLPEHWPYDLCIELEEGKLPPLGPIYSDSKKG